MPGIKIFGMPLIFLSALLLAVLFGEILPYFVKSLLYAFSLTIKECLIFVLPFVIFSLVYNAISRLGGGAVKFIAMIVPLICCSNFLNTMLSYLAGVSFLKLGAFKSITQATTAIANQLVPCFELSLPKLLSNDFALLAGMILGISSGFIEKSFLRRISSFFDLITRYFFKILIPVMPFFIMGTALKLQNDGMLSVIWTKYLSILLVFVMSAYGFVLIQFFLLSQMRIQKFLEYVKNIIPAVITGFGAMSSAAALPLSVKAAEMNSCNKKNAGIIVPSTVNIHLVGDCFFIPMMALAIMVSFGMDVPSVRQYLLFSIHFVMAKFAVAAVPGGGVLVMLPVLQTYLGFTPDMLGLITALYVLFDPIITSCNVAGNGAMAVIFDRITSLFERTEG